MTIANVVSRLKVSKLSAEAAELEEGRRCGVEWAETTASYNELKAVAYFDTCCNVALDDLGEVVTNGNAYCVFEFYDSIFGGVPSESQAEGFVQGAMSVWDQVRSSL